MRRHILYFYVALLIGVSGCASTPQENTSTSKANMLSDYLKIRVNSTGEIAQVSDPTLGCHKLRQDIPGGVCDNSDISSQLPWLGRTSGFGTIRAKSFAACEKVRTSFRFISATNCIYSPASAKTEKTLRSLSLLKKNGTSLGFVEFKSNSGCLSALSGDLNDPRAICSDQSNNTDLIYHLPINSGGTQHATLKTKSIDQCQEAKLLLKALYFSRKEISINAECSIQTESNVGVSGFGSYLKFHRNGELLAEIAADNAAECRDLAPAFFSFAKAKSVSLACATSSEQGKLSVRSDFKVSSHLEQSAFFKSVEDCAELSGLLQQRTNRTALSRCAKN